MGRMRSIWSMSVSRVGRARIAALVVVVLVVGGAVVAALGRGPAQDPPPSRAVMGGSSKSAGPPSEAATSSGVAPDGVTAESAPVGPPKTDTAALVTPPDASVGPRVVRTAELTIGVAAGAFTRAFDGITAAVTAQGGYVSASTAGTTTKGSGDNDGRRADPRSGDLTLRIPADRFDAVRTNLAGLGTVEQEQLRGEDVTAQIVDFDARLKSMQAEEEALRTLVGRATAVGEVLQVQSQLFDVRQQVERLQAQRDQLSQQASLATIHVALHEPGIAFRSPPRPATGLVHSLERAVAGASAVVGGTIVVVGWLAPAALVGLVAWVVIRLRRRGTAKVQPGPSVG